VDVEISSSCFILLHTVFSHIYFVKHDDEFLKGKYLEEYVVLNMEMGSGKVRRIEN